jgi:hypothetical protein
MVLQEPHKTNSPFLLIRIPVYNPEIHQATAGILNQAQKPGGPGSPAPLLSL